MRQTRNLLGVEWLLVGSNPTLSVVSAKFKRIDLKRELFKSKSEGAIFSAYWQLLLTIIRWFASGIIALRIMIRTLVKAENLL